MVTPLLTLIEMHSAQPPEQPRNDEREEWEMDGPLKGRGLLVAGRLHSAVTMVMLLHNTTLYNNAHRHDSTYCHVSFDHKTKHL